MTDGPEPEGPWSLQFGLAEATELLTGGTLEILGRIPWASNVTLLARACDQDGERSGAVIYKPQRGERPLWDFPTGLYRRELAAFLVSQALGWDLVPLTVVRDGPLGVGSVQLFVEAEDDVTAFDLVASQHPAMLAVAAFDVVVNNADRKGGHTLLGPDGHVWAIDHGVCFHAEPKLRTVVWDYAGQPVPDELLEDLRRLGAELDGGRGPAPELGTLLERAEVLAIGRRAAALAERGVYPAPDGDRPYPWPLV
jgi:uncharacterized repeat protein (TIGR03843 family)